MKPVECTYSYPAGTTIATNTTEPFCSPTGGCLQPPVGAFLGKRGSVWYHCSMHARHVNDLVAEHADTRDFPLVHGTVEEAVVHEVMTS